MTTELYSVKSKLVQAKTKLNFGTGTDYDSDSDRRVRESDSDSDMRVTKLPGLFIESDSNELPSPTRVAVHSILGKS